MSNEEKGPLVGFLGDLFGDEKTTQLCGDYFIRHYKDPVIKQPGFNGK